MGVPKEGGHGGVGGAVRGPCVTCHMDGAAGHSWKAVVKDEATGQVSATNSTACVTCHDGVSLPKITPEFLNAQKAAFKAALANLEAQLNNRGVTFSNGSFSFSGVSTNYATAAALAPAISQRNMQGAAYNFWLFTYEGADPAGYVHNPTYALKLINDSEVMLRTGSIPAP